MSDNHPHDHGPDQALVAQGDTEDPKAAPTWLISISGTLIFVAIVLVVTAATYNLYSEEFERKYVQGGAEVLTPVKALETAQKDRLDAPAHIEFRIENPENTPSIVIPIEEAMTLVIEEANE